MGGCYIVYSVKLTVTLVGIYISFRIDTEEYNFEVLYKDMAILYRLYDIYY